MIRATLDDMVPARRVLASTVTLLLGVLMLAAAPSYAGPADAAPAARQAPQAAGGFASTWEKRILKHTNKHRQRHGCRALKANNKLRKAARKHTRKMAAANELSHQLRGEASLGRRITQAGYRNWRGLAENIAYGHASPKSMVRAWMNSPSHRRNILNCRYRHLGVGVVIKRDVPWATQDFGHK